jgi:hypothetical protein
VLASTTKSPFVGCRRSTSPGSSEATPKAEDADTRCLSGYPGSSSTMARHPLQRRWTRPESKVPWLPPSRRLLMRLGPPLMPPLGMSCPSCTVSAWAAFPAGHRGRCTASRATQASQPPHAAKRCRCAHLPPPPSHPSDEWLLAYFVRSVPRPF